ncbi:MAG: YgiT-type zinc finger protein [Candidatus Nanoarchaeia archaeon]|nr:YgiT-type zinc finger protein [Candidatus Nanoarchaeia archaeon]
MTKCYICEKGLLKKQKVDFLLYNENLGKFDAEVCNNCGEKFFDEETSAKIDEKAKKNGLWGLEAHTSVGVAGNSLDIRLNKNIVKFLGVKKGSLVNIYPESKKKLIIEVSE